MKSHMLYIGNCFFAVFMSCCIVFLNGCATAKKNAFSDLEGKIPNRFFETVQAYHVSERWLISQLGEPDLIQNGNRGQEIFTYIFKESSMSVRKFLPIYRKAEGEYNQIFMHFVLVDKKVQSYWKDKNASIELNTLPVKTKMLHDEIIIQK